MKNYKRIPVMFAFYDRAKIEETLEKMSRKGWVIHQIGVYFWTFRKEEPKDRHVSVVYVAEASEYDPHPTAGQQMLEELSAQTGWELKCTWGQMQIYYNEQKSPVPLETDPVTQVEAIHRAMRKNGVRLAI